MKNNMKLCFFLVILLITTISHSKQLALSFDDGVNPDLNPNAQQINQRILEQLKQNHIRSIVYPSVIKIGDYKGLSLVAAQQEYLEVIIENQQDDVERLEQVVIDHLNRMAQQEFAANWTHQE